MQDGFKKIDKKLDSLADIMIDGFDRIYDKIDGLEARADKSDGKIGNIEGKIGNIEGKISNIEGDVKIIKSELTDVRIVQGRHTQTLAEHTTLLKRLDGDTEMLIEDDPRACLVTTLEARARIF